MNENNQDVCPEIIFHNEDYIIYVMVDKVASANPPTCGMKTRKHNFFYFFLIIVPFVLNFKFLAFVVFLVQVETSVLNLPVEKMDFFVPG